jgi:hypothetical protein
LKPYAAASLGLALVLSTPASGQKPPDATVNDGNVHTVLLENEHVRVIEARASVPTSSPMHSHPPLVFIGVDAARVKMGLPDGKSIMFDVNPGIVSWHPDGLQHSWVLQSGNVRVIAVEVKSAAKPASGPLPAVTRKANDAATADPDVHHVLFENDHVRVFDGRASKGRKSPMHSHTPFVFVSLGTARVNLTPSGGKSMIFDTYPGQVIWMEDAEHSWEVLAGEIRVIGVEVKSAQRAKQAGRSD